MTFEKDTFKHMKTIILDLSDVYAYLVQVMHSQTQYYVSDNCVILKTFLEKVDIHVLLSGDF